MPVIVLTKSDLCDDLENKLSEVSSVAFGIDVLVTTSTEENGYKELLPFILEGKNDCFYRLFRRGEIHSDQSSIGERTAENKWASQ